VVSWEAEQAEEAAVLVAVHALGHQVGLGAGGAGRDPFEGVRPAGREHLLVGFDEPPRRLFRVDLQVVFADDLCRRFSDEAGHGLVDEDVAALEVLDEDRVGRGLHHRLQDVVAVGNPHR